MGRPQRVAPTKYWRYLRIIMASKNVGAGLRARPLTISFSEKTLYKELLLFLLLTFFKISSIIPYGKK